MPKTIISTILITLFTLVFITLFISLEASIYLSLIIIIILVYLFFDINNKLNNARFKYHLINKHVSINIYNINNIEKHLEQEDTIYKSFYGKNAYEVYILTNNKFIVINKKFNNIDILHINLKEIEDIIINNTNINIKLNDDSTINIELYLQDLQIVQELLTAYNRSKVISTIRFEVKEEYRRNKGRSLLKLLDEYIVIDLETTGLDSLNDEIIELGAIKICNGEEIERFNTLVCPMIPISDYIESHTGITNDMVSEAPTIDEALPEFCKFIKDSVLLAHNANFDINFLYDAIKEHFDYDFKNNFIDTLRLSRMVFPDLKNHKLETLCKTFKISNKVEHRAICDCILTYKLYEHMKYYIKNDNILLNKIG